MVWMLFVLYGVVTTVEWLRTGAELNNAGQRSGEIYPFGRTKFGSRCAAKMRSMATTLAV